MALHEQADSLNKIMEESASWKLSQPDGIKPPEGLQKEKETTQAPASIHEEDDEEEEEEEEDDFEYEVKLDTTVEPDSKKPQNFFNQPISLQQPGQGASTAGHDTQGNKHFVPTPSQSKDNIFDAEYVTGQSDKPWNQPGADITDYFNYGFTEKTWEAYHNKQKKKRMEHSMQSRISVYETEQSPQGSPTGLSEYQSHDRGNSNRERNNYQERQHSQRSRNLQESDDIVQLGGDEVTITPTDNRNVDQSPRERGHRGGRRDDRGPRRDDSARREPRRGDRREREDPRRDDRRSNTRDSSPRREPSGDRSRRGSRDDRVSGRKRNDFPGSESDRKRSRYH